MNLNCLFILFRIDEETKEGLNNKAMGVAFKEEKESKL